MVEKENVEKFKSQELGREVLKEWYAEKGVSLDDVERRGVKESLERPKFTSKAQDDVDDLKEKEEEKRAKVKGKIKRLLAIGEKQGLSHAIKEARRENNPFLLDVFHDILAKDGSYKKFLKK